VTVTLLKKVIQAVRSTVEVIGNVNANMSHLRRERIISDQYCRDELMWWDNHMVRWNGKSILKREIDMVIDSDASLTGWGCSTYTYARTNGPEVRGPKQNARCI
jgi:hypothetical protein